MPPFQGSLFYPSNAYTALTGWANSYGTSGLLLNAMNAFRHRRSSAQTPRVLFPSPNREGPGVRPLFEFPLRWTGTTKSLQYSEFCLPTAIQRLRRHFHFMQSFSAFYNLLLPQYLNTFPPTITSCVLASKVAFCPVCEAAVVIMQATE